MFVVDPFAPLSGLLPSFLRLHVFRPEGEGPALLGAGFVDHAFVPIAQEDAVIGPRELFEGEFSIDFAGVLPDELGHRDTKSLGHCFDFFLVDPDVAWLAGAAFATLCAGEVEAFFVPGFCHSLNVWFSLGFQASS